MDNEQLELSSQHADARPDQHLHYPGRRNRQITLTKTYYSLIKPGIVYSNALAAGAGFLLASKGQVHFWRLIAVIVGTSLVVAAGCVFNNYVDRDIDKKMSRTKKRALASGLVSVRKALGYGTILGLSGFLILTLYTNILTVIIGLLGLFFYVAVYGISKRHTIHGTLIGTVSGATPPVAGYAAASNQLDGGALILFLIMVAWQMPHFYAIAMFRHDDYAAAKLPVWPVVRGMRSTKYQMLSYIAVFTFGVAALSLFGYSGWTFLTVMGLMGLYWFSKGIKGFKTKDDNRWGRMMFGFSLIVLLTLFVMLSVDNWLP